MSELDWKLNGHHTYYMTIKATNLVGLSVMQTSVSYSHDIVLPRKGIVIDVPGNSSTFTPIKVYVFSLVVKKNVLYQVKSMAIFLKSAS